MVEFRSDSEWDFVKNKVITDSNAAYWMGLYDYVERYNDVDLGQNSIIVPDGNEVKDSWLSEDNIDSQLWFNHYQSSMTNRE